MSFSNVAWHLNVQWNSLCHYDSTSGGLKLNANTRVSKAERDLMDYVVVSRFCYICFFLIPSRCPSVSLPLRVENFKSFSQGFGRSFFFTCNHGNPYMSRDSCLHLQAFSCFPSLLGSPSGPPWCPQSRDLFQSMQCDATRPSIITYNTLSGICTFACWKHTCGWIGCVGCLIGFEKGRHGESFVGFITSTGATVLIHQM